MADFDRIFARARGRRRVLFLDYDGTLVPFADRPHLASPDIELLALLDRLCSRRDTAVHVVTGRSRISIDAWLGHLGLGLHAEHGSWTRSHRDAEWRRRRQRDCDWLLEARNLMRESVLAVESSFIEEKESCLAWHFRLASPAAALGECARLRRRLEPLVARRRLELLDGANVLEVRERDVHKGHVVREVVETETDSFAIAIGDDITDDDMFAALPPGGFAIAASERPARAHLRLPDHRFVRALLSGLCNLSEANP